MNTRLVRFAGWSAFFCGFTSIIALVSLLLFFGLEASAGTSQGSHFWGPISDIAPIFQMLFLLIIAFIFYSSQRTLAPRLSLASCLLGGVGMVGIVFLQILLRLNILPFDQEVTPVLFATALVGMWLVMTNILGQRQRFLSLRLSRLGIAVGAAFILEPIIFTSIGGATSWRVFMSNYLLLTMSAVVFLVSYIGFPIWVFWLGKVLLKMNAPVL